MKQAQVAGERQREAPEGASILLTIASQQQRSQLSPSQRFGNGDWRRGHVLNAHRDSGGGRGDMTTHDGDIAVISLRRPRWHRHDIARLSGDITQAT